MHNVSNNSSAVPAGPADVSSQPEWDRETLLRFFADLSKGNDVALASIARQPHLVRQADFEGWTALHQAVCERAGERVIDALVQAGADVEARERVRGRTPLHCAAGRGSLYAVRALLAARADPNARDEEQTTPLMRAAEANQPAVIEPLLRGGALIDAVDDAGQTALFDAIRCLDGACTRPLLEAGANPDATTADGGSPLHVAIVCRRPEAMALLLQHGANAKVVDANDRTPLVLACEKREIEAVRMLLSHYAARQLPLASTELYWLQRLGYRPDELPPPSHRRPTPP